MYLPENDLPDQAAALTSLFYSSAGPNWTQPRLPDLIQSLKSAPPVLLALLRTTPDMSAIENEQRWISVLLHNSSDGVSAPVKLALFKLGMAKVPWMTPNTSYCSW